MKSKSRRQIDDFFMILSVPQTCQFHRQFLYLISGGSASDLFKITKKAEAYLADMRVHITSTSVDLKHRFISVQLVYNKMTLKKELMGSTPTKRTGTHPSLGSPSPNFSTTTVSSLMMLRNPTRTHTRNWETTRSCWP